MDRYEKIIAVESEIQGEILDRILTDQNIPHLMRSYHDMAFDGVFQLSRGWGSVEAPVEFKDRILRVVQQLSDVPPDADEDGENAN